MKSDNTINFVCLSAITSFDGSFIIGMTEVVMDLRFSGCGSAYYPSLGNTSAWYRLDDTLFLMDCGENVFTTMRQTDGCLQGVRTAFIFITHLHADHCGSLPTMLSYLRYVVGAAVTIIHPEASSIHAFLACSGASKSSYQIMDGTKGTLDKGITYKAYPVQHSAGMAAYGYLVSDGTERFYYSGDAARTPQEIVDAFLSGDIQRLYIDCCVTESHDHGTLSRHCQDFPERERGKITAMHLRPDDFDEICGKGFEIALQGEKHT